jgi:AcrR family transcriptional regulator
MTMAKSGPGAKQAAAAGARGRRNVRETQYEDRCQRFIDVAQALFLERGFGGTSVNEVVRQAGGSLATLYAEFGTKDELFEAVMNRRARTMFADVIAGKGKLDDTRGALLQLAKRLQDHMLADDSLAVYRLAVHEGPRFPAVRKAVLVNGLQAFLQRLADYFLGMKASGRLPVDDPLAAAELFLTLVQGQVRTIAACGEKASLTRKQRDAHVGRVVDVFLKVYPPPV